MKVTYNWLKDFVDIKITAPQLADKLTMAGLEVVSLQEKEGDFVFEIEITSNRPDWLSLVGIAREVAALTGRKLKVPQAKSAKYTAGSMQPLAIQVEDKKDCPLYTARIIKDVKVAPSPVWLKKRLELVGCRSVNNIVDITNYVLFELGEPLHAFDLAKLNPEGVIIRRAKNSEKLLTIDGENRQLNSNILVIADREKPIALAGVMGGKDTEVTTGTKDILLESAVFNPVIIRRARQALGIQSEASYRFERGVDLASVEKASLKAARSIQELAGGNQVGYQVKGVTKAQAKNIGLEISKVKKIQ
ncbi:MAG: phenylalanine--tRNA ligase beta subunit-related protein [Candidatus Omnitrophica bacterium]|nr:phenylalanine--tRNA ligase beta subunit-related protein [Candidatus Omnitrophota bacterium]